MKKVLCIAGMMAIFLLTACQINDIHDTGGGAVVPTSTVTGVKLESGGDDKP